MTIMLSGGGNAMLYRQVDDTSGYRHWDKWVKQFRSHRPFGGTLPSQQVAIFLSRLHWILAPMTSPTAPCKIII